MPTFIYRLSGRESLVAQTSPVEIKSFCISLRQYNSNCKTWYMAIKLMVRSPRLGSSGLWQQLSESSPVCSWAVGEAQNKRWTPRVKKLERWVKSLWVAVTRPSVLIIIYPYCVGMCLQWDLKNKNFHDFYWILTGWL